MPRSQKRLPASASISKTAIENATSTLQELPEKPKENWSLREAVSLLQETISDALDKGYSYEEISKMLSRQGIEISASSLKSYLSAAKRQKGTTTGTRGRKAGRKKASVATASLNGSSTNAAHSLNGAAAEATVVPTEQPTRRRTRTSKADASTRTKTAAKSKTTGRTSTKAAAKPDKPATRGRRKGSSAQ